MFKLHATGYGGVLILIILSSRKILPLDAKAMVHVNPQITISRLKVRWQLAALILSMNGEPATGNLGT